MGFDKTHFGLMEMSVVHEMANIGLGHATTALSEMTGRSFNMSVPRVDSVPVSNLMDMLGGPEALCLGVFMPMEGDIEGHIAFLFPWPSAQRLWDMLIGSHPDDPSQVADLESSAMLEIGNIMNSSFLNAIADMASLRIQATPPLVSVEMACAIIQSIVAEAVQGDVVALCIETCIFDSAEGTQGYFVCIPTVAGLERLFVSLGLSEAA